MTSNVKRSEATERFDLYDLSHAAFKKVHGRHAQLGGEESAWIRGWQSGYAESLENPQPVERLSVGKPGE